MSENQDSIWAAFMKVAVAWAGAFAGMKLSEWVLLATLIYTLLQIAKLIRDWRKK